MPIGSGQMAPEDMDHVHMPPQTQRPKLLRCNCRCASYALFFCHVLLSHPLHEAALNQVLSCCYDRDPAGVTGYGQT